MLDKLESEYKNKYIFTVGNVSPVFLYLYNIKYCFQKQVKNCTSFIDCNSYIFYLSRKEDRRKLYRYFGQLKRVNSMCHI